MLTTVLVFALITALFEFVILFKFSSPEWLRGEWEVRTWWKVWRTHRVPHVVVPHFVAFAANLIVHWGTIVGTMTAVTAALVSFATVPLAIIVMTFWRTYRATN